MKGNSKTFSNASNVRHIIDPCELIGLGRVSRPNGIYEFKLKGGSVYDN